MRSDPDGAFLAMGLPSSLPATGRASFHASQAQGLQGEAVTAGEPGKKPPLTAALT
jgi:hypothetical protein